MSHWPLGTREPGPPERALGVGRRVVRGIVASLLALGLAGLLGASRAALAGDADPANPGDPSEAPGLVGRPQLTGQWGGRRAALSERGVDLYARYLATGWSNVDGGRRDGTRYEGFGIWGIETDLGPLVGWRGGGLLVNGYVYHGAQPSDSLIGGFATQTLSGNETSDSFRFFEILFQQTWSDGRFAFKIGQLAADTDFFVSRFSGTLLNGTFGFLGFGRSDSLAPFFPLATPGVYLRARTRDDGWSLHLGVYSADEGEDETSNIGFDYSFDDGVFAIAEVRSRYRLLGRPGSTLVGGAITTGSIDDYGRGGRVAGTYGIYALIDQVLIEQSADRPELGVFARFSGTPQDDRAEGQWYFDAGFELLRPFAARPNDAFSVGFAYLRFGRDYVDRLREDGEDVTRSQSVLEITYRAQLTGWLSLQPDLQLVFDPFFSRSDATVIGLRATIDL